MPPNLSSYNAAPGDLIQYVKWPGVTRFESFQYSPTDGVTPATWILTTAPQDDDQIPDTFGNLYLSDGQRTIVLRDCKVDAMDGQRGPDGTTYIIRGFDRRWRWRNQWGGLGGIDGWYNRTDPRGKLVPYTIRSPEELARLCLQKQGEYNYVIVLPDGIRRAEGADLDRYLRLGEFFRQTNTNPEVVWDKKPPMEALAEVADRFGCVVVYQPISDRVLVVPRGYGIQSLPNHPYEMDIPSIDDPESPNKIGLSGAPVRIQARFPLEPVGEEWDGSWLPIDDLSYAPRNASGQVQINTITYNVAATPAYGLICVVTWNGNTATLTSTDNTYTLAQRWADMIARGNGNALAAADLSFSAASNVFTISGKRNDIAFNVAITPVYTAGPPPADLPTSYSLKQTQASASGGRGWSSCPPPHFRSVIATERLSYMEAVGKAQKSVWRCFRVMNADPQTRKSPLHLPWFGPLRRIQQVSLQPTKVEQVVPQARITGGQDKGNPLPFGVGGGILPEFYNGRSRDQRATVVGSIYDRIGRVFWFNPGSRNGNTRATDRVWCDFDIILTDTGDQLVVFSDYVYKWKRDAEDAAYIQKPELVLETACTVMGEENNLPVRWTYEVPIPGGIAPTEWHRHDDVQVTIVGDYGSAGALGNVLGTTHSLTGWHHGEGDKEHADSAARLYLTNHAKKYVAVFNQTRQYPGIQRIDLSGTVRQVTWTFGTDGPTTIASLGTQHSPYIPDHPARRRPEILEPDRAAMAVNWAERQYINSIYPPPKSAIK